MPMLVVGADTPLGRRIVDAAAERAGEIRVFVSDEDAAEDFRSRNAKVALGDVSDASHVGGAAIGCFTAVLIAEAASDGRERSFASDPQAIIASWVSASVEAGAQRVIVVGGPVGSRVDAALQAAPESARVTAIEDEEAAARSVMKLDDARRL